MNHFRLFLFLTLAILMVACSGESKSASPTTQPTATKKVDAGEDRYLQLNESVTLRAKSVSHQDEVTSYLWKSEKETLATTPSFVYTPTTLGVKKLTLLVRYDDGTEATDTLKVIVTKKRVDMRIPALSEALKKEYLNAINRARGEAQDCGTAGFFEATTPLKWNNKLYEAAYEHMQDLIKSKTFAHEGSGRESDWTGYALGKKSTFVERIENHGYQWSRLAENLGGGTQIDEPEEMVRNWLESDHHCANLMNPNFTEVGMVMLKDDNAKYTHYWGQELGTPK